MKWWSSVLLGAVVLLPATAQAQKKPSNNMHTRSADVYLTQAQSQKVAEDRKELLEKALSAALEGTENDPSNPKSWFQAGVAHARLGNLAQADSAFDKAEQIYPEYTPEIDPERRNAWITAYNEGVQALQAGEDAKAIAALELANAIYQKRPEALVLLGQLYLQANDAVKAEQRLREALAVLRGPGRKDLNAQEAASWSADETTVALRLSSIYADQDKHDEAIRIYRDLLASQPDNVMARANLAVVLTRAGRTDEATAMYREMLSRKDLPENTLFNIGVGLFRASQYDEATVAFKRGAALNPYSQETLYNLAQSLLAQSGELEKKTPAPQAELKKLYEEMRVIAEKLRDIDPGNRNVLMMLAQSQRSLSEAAGQTAEAEQLRRQVLATLETAEAMPFEVTDITVTPSETEVLITGRVKNVKGTAGAPARLHFIVLSREGKELASQDVTVNLPAVDESERFNMRVTAPEGAAAWKYTIGS